jgi:hypothetical protein
MFRKGGAGKRRDLAEKPIREALLAVGAEVWQVSGRGLPDLLVRFRGRYYAGEVKSKGGRLEPTQGDFPIWREADEVLREIGAVK